MKVLLLLVVGFVLFSSPLFGVEENNTSEVSALGSLQEGFCEKINTTFFPTASPAIIPDFPRVLGEQNNSDQFKKIKASFNHVFAFFFFKFQHSTCLKKWTTGPTAKHPLFILFRNLRL